MPRTSSAAARGASSCGRPGPGSAPSASPASCTTTRFSPPTRRATRRSSSVNPMAPEEADVPGQGEGRHLPVHVRRAEPRRHLRLQAELYQLDGKTITVKTFGRGGHKNQGRVVGPKWEFKHYGKCGKLVTDLFPQPGPAASTTSRSSTRMYAEVADPRLGHADDEQRAAPVRQPVPRVVGHLRPGQREREPARLRGHARQDRRADQRAEELVQRLHAGRVPGRAAPRRQDADPRPRAAARHHPRAAARAARPPEGEERGAPRQPRGQHRAGGPHRQLRARVQDAAARPGGGGLREGDRRDARRCTASTRRRPTTSAASACSPAGWSSAACGSSRSTPAAPTTTTTGTPTATW